MLAGVVASVCLRVGAGVTCRQRADGSQLENWAPILDPSQHSRDSWNVATSGPAIRLVTMKADIVRSVGFLCRAGVDQRQELLRLEE